jgi:hypothetical protein
MLVPFIARIGETIFIEREEKTPPNIPWADRCVLGH